MIVDTLKFRLHIELDIALSQLVLVLLKALEAS